MEYPPRIRLLLVPVCLATFFSAGSAQNSDELPSAPSAVIQQKTARPQPQSPATPVESQPPVESQQPAAISQTGDAAATEQPSAEQPSDDAAAPRPGNEERPTIHRTVNEVNVVFTVTDKHNRYIKDLSKNDFKVIDDEN